MNILVRVKPYLVKAQALERRQTPALHLAAMVCGPPTGSGIQRFQEFHLAAGQQRDRQAIPIEQAVAGERGQLRPGVSGCP